MELNGFESDFTLTHVQAIDWGEMDSYQHVNNMYYFRYFENIRIAYFEKVGINDYMQQHQKGPILGTTDCRYLRPLTYPDEIVIGTKVTQIKEKRFTMRYGIFSCTQQTLAAQGTGEIVYVDYSAERSCKIPESLLNNIRNLEKEQKG